MEYAKPTLKDVQIVPDHTVKRRYMVTPVWGGVDRPMTMTWTGLTRSLALRLTKAIKAGAVESNPRIKTDVHGKTYVETDGFIMCKYMGPGLKRLGF